MIEVLLERFLIYNASPSEKHQGNDDKKKYQGKQIITYIYLLDKCDYIKIDWDWDIKLKDNIKNELKVFIKNFYEDEHKDIYDYLNHIKNDNEKIFENNIDDFIKACEKKENYPKYIIDFFNSLLDHIENDEDFDYINDFNKFNKRLNKKLEKSCDKFFL